MYNPKTTMRISWHCRQSLRLILRCVWNTEHVLGLIKGLSDAIVSLFRHLQDTSLFVNKSKFELRTEAIQKESLDSESFY